MPCPTVPASEPPRQAAAEPRSASPSAAREDRRAASRPVVAVSLLTAHPGNVRRGPGPQRRFCASVTADRRAVPLQVTRRRPAAYRVIDGHRRLAAAVQAGLAEVPWSRSWRRRGRSPASSWTCGSPTATPTELRALGGGRRPVRGAGGGGHQGPDPQGHRAQGRRGHRRPGRGGLSGDTRATAEALPSQLTLEDLAILAEFEGDQVAIGKLVEAFRHGYTAEHVAERIRQDRAEAAEHERLIAELEAAGIAITDDLPDGAARLSSLLLFTKVSFLLAWPGCLA